MTKSGSLSKGNVILCFIVFHGCDFINQRQEFPPPKIRILIIVILYCCGLEWNQKYPQLCLYCHNCAESIYHLIYMLNYIDMMQEKAMQSSRDAECINKRSIYYSLKTFSETYLKSNILK